MFTEISRCIHLPPGRFGCLCLFLLQRSQAAPFHRHPPLRPSPNRPSLCPSRSLIAACRSCCRTLCCSSAGKLNCNPPPLRRLQTFVNCATQDRPIELLGSPTVAVATKLRTGEVAAFRRGDLNLAVRASSSAPDVFMPPKIDDVDFVDGGLVNPVPVRIARDVGADCVIAVDVSRGPLNTTPVGIYEQVMHSFAIMGQLLAKLEADQADVVIRPDLARLASTDFSSRSVFIEIGQSAGTRFAPVLQEKLALWRAGKKRA